MDGQQLKELMSQAFWAFVACDDQVDSHSRCSKASHIKSPPIVITIDVLPMTFFECLLPTHHDS